MGFISYRIKRQQLLPLVMLLVLPHFVRSQSFNIYGRVTNNSSPVRYAAVVFTDQADTSRHFGTLTDSLGSYALSIITSVSHDGVQVPRDIRLAQNYPNPFTEQTAIEYEVPAQQDAAVKIYNILGQEIKKFSVSPQNHGLHSIVWDGRDNSGNRVSPGVYLYQLLTRKGTVVKKMVHLFSSVAQTLPLRIAPTEFSNVQEERRQNLSGMFTVKVQSTDSTQPQIVVKEIANIDIHSDTTIDFVVEEARIILGKSIDGVLPGDDSLTVSQKLGSPDLIHGDDFWGIIFEYSNSLNPHTRTSILISQDTVGRTGVFDYFVWPPYKGKTKDGIGIGALRNTTWHLIGPPEFIDSTNSSVTDYYFYPVSIGGYTILQFHFAYDRLTDTIYQIRMSAQP